MQNDLQDLQEKLIQGGRPFAFWSLPGSVDWQGIAQNDTHIDLFDAQHSDGFIIKAFNDNKNIGFIRSDLRFDSENLTYKNEIESAISASTIDLPKELSKDDYLIQCTSIIDSIRNNNAEKVVLSRVKKKKYDGEAALLFLRLVDAYPDAMVFLYFFKDRLWIGATPETLLKVEGDKFYTMALAGSKASGMETKWTNKEREEQVYVERYVDMQLKKHALEYSTEGPKTINAGPIEHLCTAFRGDLISGKYLDLLNDLHPTPAVCGIPVETAKKIIEKVENHDRLDYTGFIGPVNRLAKHLFVNLRSALIAKDYMYLFLGGGITKDSIPEEEWNETELKARTLLRIL